MSNAPEEAGGPLPGSVSEQFIKCGKAQCHCRTGRLHGPYFYRVWRGEGRAVHKVYVKAAEVASVRARCAEYRAFDEEMRGLRARRRALSARLRVQVALSRRLRAAPPPPPAIRAPKGERQGRNEPRNG